MTRPLRLAPMLVAARAAPLLTLFPALILAVLTGLLSPASALAQDTAGSWAPTFTARHGGWDVTCDKRGEGEALEERCFVRYIDAYSPRPNFGVVFLFLQIEGGAPMISLGREFETDLVASTLRVDPGWERSEGVCDEGTCEISGEDAVEFTDAVRAGGSIEIGFTDSQDNPQLRRWPADGFTEAFAEIEREAAARGL
ncbi:MAG: hypothetical protein AAGH60_03315 [Pseudomonadota bacterium]